MRNNLDNAKRWIMQARHDLEIAQRHLKEGYYSDACFMSEQSSQKALKAYLFFAGERSVMFHSLVKLVEESSIKDSRFKELRDAARILDKYYIPTRYPDALPMPAVPYEAYDVEDAKEALDCAQRIMDLVLMKVK